MKRDCRHGRRPGPGFHDLRLSVQHLHTVLGDAAARQGLEENLHGWLTPAVLADLPPSLQLDRSGSAISDWIDARAAESDVYRVLDPSAATVGLLVLVSDSGSNAADEIHLGYLFAERAWGQGYATELINGLVRAVSGRGVARLLAGVSRANPASARVLRKCGFTTLRAGATDETQLFRRVV